jgi:two-component system, response regulator
MNTLGMQILLFEDDPSDVEITLHALRDNGVANRIDVARNREEALDLLFSRATYREQEGYRQPGIIFLNETLRKQIGISILKSDPATRRIPVILMLASSMQNEEMKPDDSLVDGYIRKPLDFDQFKEIAKQLGFSWVMVSDVLQPAVRQAAHVHNE